MARRFPVRREAIPGGRTSEDTVGYAPYLAQLGRISPQASRFTASAAVIGVAAHDVQGAFRAVYTVSIGDSIYVVHAFQKKSKAGIATPKVEMDLVRQRLKQLRKEVKDAEEAKS